MPVRPAHATDAAPIVAILDREIREGVAHFGDTPPTEAEVRADIARQASHPYLVADEGGRVMGFASLKPWRERAAYRWSAEVGIYLAPDGQGRGLGGQLLDGLVARAPGAGLRNLVAGIALPNPASQRLFESRGFSPVGVFEAIGFKHGRWHDVGYWMLRLPG